MAPRRITQADVARQAGVSRATVSLVLNPQAQTRIPISEETRQRVLQAVRELGYTPNPVARMLARGSNRLIGVYTYEPTFPYEQEDFYHPFLTGIERGAQEAGYNVLLFTSARGSGQRRIYADGSNILRLADGAILLGAFPDRAELSRLVKEQYPFVYIGRREIPNGTIDWVASDYASACAQAVRHLVDLGHRALGYVAHRPQQESHQDRLAGCKSVADPAAVRIVLLPDSDAMTDRQLLELVHQHHLTAILCTEENRFSDVMAMLEGNGIRVPQDISVVCLSSVDRPQNIARRPSCLQLDRPAVGEAAVKLLVSRLNGAGPSERQHILVPSSFVPGTTSGPAAS